MSQGANIAAVMVADTSFDVGGNWAYLSNTNPDYEELLGYLQEDTDKVKLVEVSNGYIVLCDINYLLMAIRNVAECDATTVDKLNKRRLTELNSIAAFVNDILSGNSKYLVQKRGYRELVIGLYSSNNLNRLRLNGINYPAFKLTLTEFLTTLQPLLTVFDVYVCCNSKFIKLSELKTQTELIGVTKTMEISDTLTGVFITLRLIEK